MSRKQTKAIDLQVDFRRRCPPRLARLRSTPFGGSLAFLARLRVRATHRCIAAIALFIGIGSGCGSSGGCGALKPLPPGLTPFGVPSSQVIEGGMQARLTKAGLKKFSKVIEDLIATQLNGVLGCIIDKKSFVDLRPITNDYLVLCPTVQAACGRAACGGQVVFNSKDRPAPWNIDDGLDKADFYMADGANPVMNVDLAFDIYSLTNVSYASAIFGISPGTCNVEVSSEHYSGDATKKNFHITVPIQLSIDPATGKLKLTTQAIKVASLGLKIGTNGCGTIISTIGSALSSFLGFFDSQIGNLLLNLAGAVLQPQVDQLVQGLLPDPLGLASVLDTGTMLARFDAPKEAGLETYLVPGGYVSSKDRGLTLGVLAGMNSDFTPATRDAANSSDPNPCVPIRPAPDLGAAPWSLPANATRMDHTLDPAGAFAGMPDPLDGNGDLRDVLLGVSRTYLDVAGFHLYNSGSLCLHIDGSAISQLSTGTLGLLVPSLSAIAEEPKAPLQLILRPQKPVVFTIGAGTASDALIHVALSDLRIDMYTWIEERWVRFLTLGVDLNIGLDLTVTKDASMNPVLQPVLSGLDASSITVHVTNTDLLTEVPMQLETALTSLIKIAAGALAGSLPTVALPSVGGFSLDDLAVQRVQSGMDDFVGVFATIKTPTTPAPRLDWTDPQHPRLAGELRTSARLDGVTVPAAGQLRALFDPSTGVQAARPSVRLALSAEGAAGRTVEYAWKIDGGLYHPWSTDAHPLIEDDALLLQGHHQITVRSRLTGDYRSEDTQPVTLDVLIDSVAPALRPHLDDKDPTRLRFGGWDLVSDSDHLDYAYLDAAGALRGFSKLDALSLVEIGRITEEGRRPLVVSVRDEAGLIGTFPLDVKPYGHGTWGVPAPTSGCDLGGAGGQDRGSLWIVMIGLLALLLRRRQLTRALALCAVLVAASTLIAGCGCDHNAGQCTVDDDCRKMQCDVGKLPHCQVDMCICVPDLSQGASGRYASMTIIDSTAYVASYNTTYGDLMIGSVQPPGRIDNWSFVDGVPEEAPATIGSHIRGGVATPGDDVGKFTSIARTPQGEPVVAYYDATNGALKFASFGAIRWRAHVVDKGQGLPETQGDSIGTWASLTLDAQGRPGIAYAATVNSGTMSGKPEGQLRFAQANVADPHSATDWTITVVDSRPLAAQPDMGVELLSDSIAIMTAAGRRLDGTPAIAYYDRERGNLRYAEQSMSGEWTVSILDGEAAGGTDTGDVGQFPSLFFDASDIGHISYVDASHDNLLYVDTKDRTPVVVDDGYRPMDEMTSDGLPSPVFHLVGDSSSIQAVQNKLIIAYQDSTTVELRLAVRDGAGPWTTQKVAGHDNPYRGSYGFWASARLGGRGAYLGSYAINQMVQPLDYYFEVFFLDLGIVQ